MKTFIFTLSAFVLVLTPATCSLDQNNYGDASINVSTQTASANSNETITVNTDGTPIDPPIMPTKPQ